MSAWVVGALAAGYVMRALWRARAEERAAVAAAQAEQDDRAAAAAAQADQADARERADDRAIADNLDI